MNIASKRHFQYDLIWCNNEQLIRWPIEKEKKDCIELIPKVLNLLWKVSDLNIFQSQIISWPLGFMIGWESKHSFNQMFQFHCYFTVFAHSAHSTVFPLITHILQISICRQFLTFYGHVQSAWGFLLRYWCHANVSRAHSSIKRRGGCLHSYYMTQWSSHSLESVYISL